MSEHKGDSMYLSGHICFYGCLKDAGQKKMDSLCLLFITVTAWEIAPTGKNQMVPYLGRTEKRESLEVYSENTSMGKTHPVNAEQHSILLGIWVFTF